MAAAPTCLPVQEYSSKLSFPIAEQPIEVTFLNLNLCRETEIHIPSTYSAKMLPIILVFMAFLVVSCLYVYKQWFGNGSCIHEVDCVLCLSKVCKGEKRRSLPICHHGFHAHCIDVWLRVRPTCPLCRIDVAPHRNVLISSMLSFAKRVGKWIENPLSLELTSAVSESFGYI